MFEYRVISSDDHVFEPPDLWTSRVEPKFRERAPKIIRMGEDGDWWWCDGLKVSHMGAGAQVGVRFENPEKLSRTDVFEHVRPGGYIPEEHVKDMDIDGIDVSIVYPTIGFLLYNVILDSQLLSALFRTYNDWVADFCSSSPDRLKGISMLNTDDVQTGVRELERCAKLGYVGAMIPAYPPEGRGYNMPEYEPLWAAAQDLQMPLGLHVNTNRPGPGLETAKTDSVTPAFQSSRDFWVKMSIGHMIFSGVFERYPKLQVGAVEHELGWVPYFLNQMDYTYTQRHRREFWHRFKEDMLPSDYFHRNVFLGFQEDALGIRLRDLIGVDNLLWGSDYPHAESTFPKTREILEDILSDCTEEEKAKIVGGNAARVYRLV